MDVWSQITDERTQVHSAQFSLVVTHPSTNRARRYLTSVTESHEQALFATADLRLHGIQLNMVHCQVQL